MGFTVCGSGLRVYRVPFLDLADIPSFRGM